MIPISEATGSTPEPHRRRNPTPEELEAERERARQKSREWRQRPGNKEREAATKAARREADPEAWQKMRRSAGRRHYETNRDAICQAVREADAARRAEVIAAYGGRCACPGCHVHHAELLTVDHIGGGGNAHRRLIGRGSRDFYRWLQRNGYPEGFQLLCGSCNLAKADKDKCPLAGEDH